MTHAILVKRARAWLFARCPVVISELASGREIADAIGLGHNQSMLIECKANRSDFLADGKKFFRHSHKFGVGNLRYYLCPRGLIKADEIPENWGLLYCAERRISVIKEAQNLAKDHQAEVSLLISILRRVHTCPEAVSVKFYNIETKNRSTVLLRTEAKEATLAPPQPAKVTRKDFETLVVGIYASGGGDKGPVPDNMAPMDWAEQWFREKGIAVAGDGEGE